MEKKVSNLLQNKANDFYDDSSSGQHIIRSNRAVRLGEQHRENAACFPQPCRVQSLGEKATVRVRAGIWKEPEKRRRFVVLARSISLLRKRGSQPLQSGQAP